MIDISADMGEGSPGEDEIWPLIDSANVACGGHIGDAESMAYAARRAREHGVRLGAHPSYPDRENFGRKSISMTPAALRASLAAQIRALLAIAPIDFVKPHGRLLIFKIDVSQRQGWMNKDFWEWLREKNQAV